MSSFNLFRSLRYVIGKDRVVTLYYRLMYRWVARIGLTTFNYGYAPLSKDIETDFSCKEPYQIELYRQIASSQGENTLSDRTVLEISCGLGGGLYHLSRNFGIEYCIGLDRSVGALRHAKRFGYPVIAGDARQLPFRDNSFEIVINVESSGNYFSRDFISEIGRVLKSTGLLIMSDDRHGSPAEVELMMRRDLECFGLMVVLFRDVTANVAAACTLDMPRREDILAKIPWLVRGSVSQWVGAKGSLRYQEFREKRATYFILVAKRIMK